MYLYKGGCGGHKTSSFVDWCDAGIADGTTAAAAEERAEEGVGCPRAGVVYLMGLGLVKVSKRSQKQL